MKRKTLALAIVIQFILCQLVLGQARDWVNVPVKQNSTQKRDEVLYRNSYALLIGNSYYTEWNSLPGVERDIPQVEAVLRDKHGFTVEKALNLSKIELLSRIDQFISKYGQNYENRLLIYYAGHGYTAVLPDKRVMGYLVTKDAPQVPPVEESLLKTPKNLGEFRLNAVSMGEIENLAKEISTRHALFVFDSCFSGTALYRDNSIEIPKEISAEELEQMRGFLTAGNERQRVRDDSPFRRAFIKGLEGKADPNGDGFILSSELGAFVKREVFLETRDSDTPQSPIFGKQTNFTRGDMVFVAPKINSPLPSPTNNIAESISPEREANAVRPQPKPLPVEIVSNTPKSSLASIISDTNVTQPTNTNITQPINTSVTQPAIKPEAKTLAEQALNEAMNYNWKGANQLAGEALAIDNKLPMALAISGWMKFKDDWEAKALKEGRSKMEKSVQLEPDSALFLVLLARHARLGRVYKKNTIISDPADKQLAGKLAAQVLTFKPKTGIDYYAQAIARKIIAGDYNNASDKNKIWAAAIADLTKAIELSPQYSIIYQERAATYYELKKYDEAVADYTTFIQMKPELDLGYYERGNIYKERSQDYDKAIKDFDKSIEISPNKSRHFQGRGKVYISKGDFNQAIADFTKAIQLFPENYVYYFDRAMVYEKTGRMDLAQADRKKGTKLQN